MPYTAPILFTGNHVAAVSGQSAIVGGNPGDPNFGMQITGATAIGNADEGFSPVLVSK